MAGPGGVLTCTDSHSPATPSTATSATVASCHGRSRVQTSRVVAAGTTSSAVASSAPSVERAATATSATSARSAMSGAAERAPRARADARIEARRQPALLEHEPAHHHDRRADGGEGVVAAVDEQQAAEEQRLDAAGRVKDVAGEDHADGQRRDEDECGQRVVAVARALAAGEQADGQGHQGGGRAGAEDGREAEPVGQDEPREGGGADRVGVEGQPAQDDPRADEPAGHGEDQHLDDPVLHEGQLKRLEHRRQLTGMRIVLVSVAARSGTSQVPRSALRGDRLSRPPGHPSRTGSRTVRTPRRTAPDEGDDDPVSCR